MKRRSRLTRSVLRLGESVRFEVPLTAVRFMLPAGLPARRFWGVESRKPSSQELNYESGKVASEEGSQNRR
jgi:hypothetical protein